MIIAHQRWGSRFLAITVCCLLVLGDRAEALVGGAQLATEDLAHAVVGIVGPHDSFCTATAIAPDLLLTAGHCVQPGANYKMQYKDPKGVRRFYDIIEVRRHPQFSLQGTGATADLAIVKLASSLPENIEVAALGMQQPFIWSGDHFTVIGQGVSVHGNHQTGINRVAILVATGPYSSLQIRLINPSGKLTMGACNGDSGSPVFQILKDGTKLIGVVSWGGGTNGRKGCGGVTGATLLSPYRQWIMETMGKLGSSPAK